MRRRAAAYAMGCSPAFPSSSGSLGGAFSRVVGGRGERRDPARRHGGEHHTNKAAPVLFRAVCFPRAGAGSACGGGGGGGASALIPAGFEDLIMEEWRAGMGIEDPRI
jgi:hypothetical protein